MGKSAIKLKLKGKYECLSALYSAMITHDFTAGFPLLHGEGVYSQIAFPELDRNNQVQICRNAFTGSYWVLRVTSSAGNVLNNSEKFLCHICHGETVNESRDRYSSGVLVA